jgi:hypothetical protein
VTKAARATSSKPAAGRSATRPIALARAIARVARRVRLQRALNAASFAGAFALSVLGPVLLFTRTRAFGDSARIAWLAAGVALVLSAALVAGVRRVPRLAVARTIDRAEQLSDLLASAWSFAQLSAAQQTPFMRATLARAEARAQHVAAASVWPLRWPSVLIAWPLLVVGVVWLWQRPLPAQPVRSVERSLPALLLAGAEVDAALSSLRRAAVPADDLALRALNAEYARLLELIARQGIERLALLRALGELEAKLLATFEHSAQQQAELRELGRVLAGASATQQLGAALASGDLAAGQAALQQLAWSVSGQRCALRSPSMRQSGERAWRKRGAARTLRCISVKPSRPPRLPRSGQRPNANLTSCCDKSAPNDSKPALVRASVNSTGWNASWSMRPKPRRAHRRRTANRRTQDRRARSSPGRVLAQRPRVSCRARLRQCNACNATHSTTVRSSDWANASPSCASASRNTTPSRSPKLRTNALPVLGSSLKPHATTRPRSSRPRRTSPKLEINPCRSRPRRTMRKLHSGRARVNLKLETHARSRR